MGVEKKHFTPIFNTKPDHPGVFQSCVGGECLANGELYNANICFLRALPRIYQEEGIDVHADELSHLNSHGVLHRSITMLGEQFTIANRRIAKVANEHLGPETSLSAATAIVSELTPLVNALFIANVRQNHAGRFLEPTWSSTNPDTVSSIQRKVTSIMKRDKYQTYLSQSPETKEILDLFAYALPEISDPDELYEIFMHIDALSQKQYEQGLPVFIIPFTEYYSSNGNSRHRPITPEATIRLLMPAPIDERHQCEKAETDLWNQVLESHPHAEILTKPTVMLGKWIMSAGSDIPSITAAERLSEGTIMLVNNLYKNFDRVQNASRLCNVALTPSDIRNLMVYAYTAHEFGHFHYNLSDRTFEELDTDLTMLHTILTHGREHDFTTEQLVCFILGDYARQTLQMPTSAITTDGYRISGIHMIEGLRRGGYIRLVNDSVVISEGTPDALLLEYHTAIHAENKNFRQEIMNIQLSDEGRAIAQRILLG